MNQIKIHLFVGLEDVDLQSLVGTFGTTVLLVNIIYRHCILFVNN